MKVSIAKKKNTGIHNKKWFIHKCIAQVSPCDFAFSQNERRFSQRVLREEREGKPREHRLLPMELVCALRISNKTLMLTMKRMVQQQEIPVGGVPPPWSRVLDSDNCINESNHQYFASSKVPCKLNDFLRMELETRFEPLLHNMVGALRMNIWLEIVRKPPDSLVEEDVVAKLVEVFGLLSTIVAAEDVLRDVVQKCVIAFQMIEAEAVLVEQMLCYN